LYALFGKEMYAYKVSFDNNNVNVPNDYDFETGAYRQGYAPDFNFDTFLNSFTTVFISVAVEGWSDIQYTFQRAHAVSPLLTLVFFYSLFIVSRMVLYQFFLAILLKEFDNQYQKKKIAQEAEQAKDI
jgi:hypothetical protein